jgi:hypothetical protein
MNTPIDPNDAAIEQGLRQSRRLEDAPEPVILRALDVWQMRRQATAAPSLLQRVLAVLTFDSGAASPLAFGMRSAGGTTRQMLFSAAGHDVDLRISPAGDTRGEQWLLSGQVLGPEGQAVVFLSDVQGHAVGESALSELGEFRLPPVQPGQYTVTLRLASSDIVLPAIDVPQAA